MRTFGVNFIAALSGPFIDVKFRKRNFIVRYASNIFQKIVYLRPYFFTVILKMYSSVFGLNYFVFKKEATISTGSILMNVNVVSVFGLFVKAGESISTIQQSRNPSFSFEKIHSRLVPIVDPLLRINTQSIVTASTSTPYNYYHFLTDYILPFLTLENNRKKELYLPFRPTDWQIDVLSEFSIKYQHASFQANSFFSTIEVIPSMFANASPYKDPTNNRFNLNMISKLRVKLLNTNSSKKYKIYCSRVGFPRDLKYSKLVEDLFRSRGFIIYNANYMGFKQAKNIFSNSKMIVGTHGAALTNLIFAPRECKVIEFVPTKFKGDRESSFVFKDLAVASNLHYKRVTYEDSFDYWSKTILNLGLSK
jgi:hypothetical protein